MRPKRLISLLVAVCMMITMLPLSAVTAFAADTSYLILPFMSRNAENRLFRTILDRIGNQLVQNKAHPLFI